jgi:PKHD-type hydroxylase
MVYHKQKQWRELVDMEIENYQNKKLKDIKRKRNSDLVWLNDAWIYKEIQPYVNQANRNAGWNFEWNFSESCQFTKYKLNQYYDWHCDSWDKPYDKLNTKEYGKIRKLSMTCQLTDGSEYEGGELEFDFRNYDPHMRDESKHRIQCKEILPKGSIIVFPSFVWHRVKPVTKGVRYSLVVWNLGYPFK